MSNGRLLLILSMAFWYSMPTVAAEDLPDRISK